MADHISPVLLVERLCAIAEQEQRSVEAVLFDMIAQYQSRPDDSPVAKLSSVAEELAAREAAFDDNMAHLSIYMKRAMEDYFKDQADDTE